MKARGGLKCSEIDERGHGPLRFGVVRTLPEKGAHRERLIQ